MGTRRLNTIVGALAALAASVVAADPRPITAGFCVDSSCSGWITYGVDPSGRPLPDIVRTDHACRGPTAAYGHCVVYSVNRPAARPIKGMEFDVQATCDRPTARIQYWNPVVRGFSPPSAPSFARYGDHRFGDRHIWDGVGPTYAFADPLWRFSCSQMIPSRCFLVPVAGPDGWRWRWHCPVVRYDKAAELWIGAP